MNSIGDARAVGDSHDYIDSRSRKLGMLICRRELHVNDD